ncbi:hypothetical protein [Streptomyces sp. CAU 1734]|uniref:hypothetical protein n=1 Tax=Streptomyces sp. CAU 1734 TaxID=3140360 RepID=UPI0032619B07
MTCRIQCKHDPDDTLTVLASMGGDVQFIPPADGSDVYASRATARGFARRILALCDEADGVKADESPAEAGEEPRVGDRVRVVVADPIAPTLSERFIGREGLITRKDPGRGLPYLVRFGLGDHGAADGTWWCKEVAKVSEPVDGSAAPPPLNRFDALRKARDLVGDDDIARLISVARFLVGEDA